MGRNILSLSPTLNPHSIHLSHTLIYSFISPASKTCSCFAVSLNQDINYPVLPCLTPTPSLIPTRNITRCKLAALTHL